MTATIATILKLAHFDPVIRSVFKLKEHGVIETDADMLCEMVVCLHKRTVHLTKECERLHSYVHPQFGWCKVTLLDEPRNLIQVRWPENSSSHAYWALVMPCTLRKVDN